MSRFPRQITTIKDALRRYKRHTKRSMINLHGENDSVNNHAAFIRSDLLNPLQESVFTYLKQEVYPRFLSSTQGRLCFEALLLESELRTSLIRSEMVSDDKKQNW